MSGTCHIMGHSKIFLFLVISCLWVGNNGQINKFKVSRNRAGSSKFSLNPFKPIMNLMRQDPMKAAAQRQIPKYLPPPPNMYSQMMAQPSRISSYGVHPYRPYPSHTTRVLPPTTMSLIPPMAAAPSSLVLSALVNDHHHHHNGYNNYQNSYSQSHSVSHSQPSYSSHNHYKPQASDLQIKAVRIPSKLRRPTNVESLNIADSVVRQLLDLQPPQQDQQQNYPSVLVIEEPNVASSNEPNEMYSDIVSPQQKLIMSPPVHANLESDSSSDISSSSSSNPEVFVIVSKNKNKNTFFSDDKKSDILTTSSSTPKLKKYKITSAYDENGGRQVWIIKR